MSDLLIFSWAVALVCVCVAVVCVVWARLSSEDVARFSDHLERDMMAEYSELDEQEKFAILQAVKARKL